MSFEYIMSHRSKGTDRQGEGHSLFLSAIQVDKHKLKLKENYDMRITMSNCI